MPPTVLLTVTGDAETAALHADTTVPLAELLPVWAQHCSTRPAEDLVAVTGDNTTLLDPGVTLAELGLGYGSVIRLLAGDQALHLLDAHTLQPPATTTTSPAPPLAAEPGATPDRPPRARPGGPQPGGDGLPARVPGRRRFRRALKAAMSPASVPARPAGAFAKPARTTAAERYRSALRVTNRSHNLDTIIRTAPLDRCQVVAIVSPKGGPGKTTITALLGTLLAELRRDPVIALDANPDLGDLNDKLGTDRTAAAPVDDLAAWLHQHPGVTPAELSARLGVGPHGVRYIPTPRPPECSKERMIAAADFDLYHDLIARLRDYAGIVLVDCGTGLLDPPVRAALETADQIVLVTDSSATTARQVVAAAELLPATTPTWLVANKMPPKGSTLDLHQVVAAIARLRGVTVVPAHHGRHLAEDIVTPAFRWPDAPPAWREPISELAARLASNWQPQS